MNEWKPILRLFAVIQLFLLLAIVAMPIIIRHLTQTGGKWVYGICTAICIYLGLLLRRVLTRLE